MFSPGSQASPAGPARNTSAGRRPIGSPGTTKTGSQRLIRTPNHAQLVQLDHGGASASEFSQHRRADSGLDESLSEEEMLDETELVASRRASAAVAAADLSSRKVAASSSPPPPPPPPETPPSSTPPPRQYTYANSDVSAETSRSVTPVTPVQHAAGVPMPAARGSAVAAPPEGSMSASSTPGAGGRGRGTRQRPSTLSSEAVESPASPDLPDDVKVVRNPPKTTATETRSQVKINAETPAAQRAQQQRRAEKPPRESGGSGGLGDRDTTTPPRKFTLGSKHLVGAGSFGTVYRALDTTNNQSIAVKEIRLQHIENPARAKKELEALEREIRVMQKLSHPNIVKYLGYQHGEGTFNIIMEFVSCGTVSSVLKTFGPLQPIQAALFTKHVLAGLEYLHSKRIAHRDLKGDNLFVDVDGAVKLGDFGTAKELQTIKSTAFNSIAGTPYFMAPEVVKNGGHGLEADVWSVGCCVIQMLGGQPPFKSFENQITVMFQVSKGEIEPQIPKGIPDDAKDFILQCCQVDPKKRPRISELIKHPWLASAPPIPSELANAGEAPYVPPSGQGSSSASGAPATRAHAARPRDTPPRPTGSGKRGPSAAAPTQRAGTGSAGSRSTSVSPPPRPISKEATSAARGVAAARQMRSQVDRPGGAASQQGQRRQATPKKS